MSAFLLLTVANLRVYSLRVCFVFSLFCFDLFFFSRAVASVDFFLFLGQYFQISRLWVLGEYSLKVRRNLYHALKEVPNLISAKSFFFQLNGRRMNGKSQHVWMPRSTKHYCVGTVIYVRCCNLDIALDNSLYITRQSLGKQKQMANTLEGKPEKGVLYTL